MMEIFRVALGDDRIIGEKFPQEKVALKKGELEAQYQYRRYLLEQSRSKSSEEIRDMNPDGFWECPLTVQGASYRPEIRELLQRIGTEDKPSACKIVSQGLYRSNPVYVDSVIYMLRKPESVARSQERLSREFRVKHPETGRGVNLFDSFVIQSPQMFIEVTLQASKWFLAHPEVPLYIVRFEDLITYPKEELRFLGSLLGEDLMLGKVCVKPALNRSSQAPIIHSLMGEANKVYQLFLQRDWNGLKAYGVDRTTRNSRQNYQWVCARSGSMVLEAICQSCKTDPEFRASLKLEAESKGLGWDSQPCAYDCAYDVQRKIHVPVSDSIRDNHWREVS